MLDSTPTPPAAAADSPVLPSAPVDEGVDRRLPVFLGRLFGVLLLLIGLVWFAISLGLQPSAVASPSLNRTLSLVVQIAQQGMLLGDRTLSETQDRFNSVMVTVFVDQLSDAQRVTFNTLTSALRSLLSDLFSPLGGLTLLGLLVARITLAKAVDNRLKQLGR